MDLANYFNETMLDNAHPVSKGIKYYLKNFIKDHEQETMLKLYLAHYYRHYYKNESEDKNDSNEKKYIETELPKFIDETRRCLLLNNYFWGVWALKMLKYDKLGDP